ncbi:MAG: metal ABC transporter substrate-binding protein, partial [Defluviitaleaceae bacterium]|nr:metal ABC transporter substrate-binding protein [Defluviitaleaceae bacterium]
FEPSPRDIIALNNADLIVYVGGHGEAWVDMILDSLDQPNLQRVALVDLVDVIHEHEHSHGHDDHHEHEHSHGHDDHHEHEHSHGEFDEHVWTSPRNAISIVRALTDILTELDPDNANYFRENSEVFILELEELDRAFAEVVAEGNRSTVIFGDRFPFRYLMNAYGLNYYAAFPGCSAETQASPATIAFLIDKVNAESIPVVFYTEFSARMIANVIVEATGARPFELHSAHNVSHADFIGGVTYLDIMRQNLEQLREALN